MPRPPLLLHVFPTFVPGGAQVRTVRLMNALAGELRHAVQALDGATDAAELVEPGVDLQVLPAFAKGGSVATTRQLRRVISAQRPDAVLTYNWGALDAQLAARLPPSLPTVHHEDGFGPDEASGFKRRRVLARRLVLRGARAVVVPSHTLEALARELWRLPASLVRRIPNGVRTERFPPADGNAELRAALGIEPDAFVVGTVGHLRREKNPLRFVEALARLAELGPEQPAVHGLVLGAGPEQAAVEARIAERGLGGRVHLVGHRDDTPAYYAAMDAFCLSSDTEQMPVALLEAMSSALPVVATDVGDVRRILPASGGSLLVPSDGDAAEGLARALGTLAGDLKTRRRLGAENRERAREAYSFDAMVAAYRAVYADALARRS